MRSVPQRGSAWARLTPARCWSSEATHALPRCGTDLIGTPLRLARVFWWIVLFSLDNEVGTIEPGRRADLIVLDANPVDNISNIRKVRFVMTQGRMFDCAKLWEIVGFQP